jgi:AraC family transcriptional regulator, regulatory protein of adaptative response / DNA-3-methyladenine glycosylase II
MDVTPGAIRLELAYRPPYDWSSLLGFLAGRAARGVEAIVDGRFVRTLAIHGAAGWLAVGPSTRPGSLDLEVSASLAPVVDEVAARTARTFDLATDPSTIARALGQLAAANPGLRVPGAYDGFEIAIRAILGQQVSVKGASTLAGRFAEAFGDSIVTPFPVLSRLSPRASRIGESAVVGIARIGMPGARATTILALARAVRDGAVSLDHGSEPAATTSALTALPGIGDWTAQYVAMRALHWPDAFPASDLGVRKALGGINASRAAARAEAWRPWRSYAVMHLWSSLAIDPSQSLAAGGPAQ